MHTQFLQCTDDFQIFNKVLPRFRFVKMDNYLKKIAVEAGGIENLRRLQVEKVDTQGNV